MTSSLQNKSSRYVQGGITEVGEIGMEWWGKISFPTDSTDYIWEVTKEQEYRIDKIAYTFYQDPSLWWFIAQYNNILDPSLEIVMGRILYIPTQSRMQMMLTGKTGGVKSTRNPEAILPPLVL